MRRNKALELGWYRHVFLRRPHEELNELLSLPMGLSGIYLIGCAKAIIYVGQSLRLKERPIESLGRYYHRVPDTSLSWSIAFAPCPPDEMDERESTAIRCYAPNYNTSIPSLPKSQGRMPEVIGVAAVFGDQMGPCGAFNPDSLKRQMEKARTNPTPPWKRKRTRRKAVASKPKPNPRMPSFEQYFGETIDSFQRSIAVPRRGPLPFKINLCEGGDVITKDGEIIGVWKIEENLQLSFAPNDASEPLFTEITLGWLFEQIKEWYEAETGDLIS